MNRSAARAELEDLLHVALRAVAPAAALAAVVQQDGRGLRLAGERVGPDVRLVVLAAGKAAAAMAQALEQLAGDRIARGLAVTRDGHGLPLRCSVLREASHPFPDARAVRAAREALALAEGVAPGEELVVLLSGGASSLLSCPAPGLALGDLVATTALLLASGADIVETNTVRKHLSSVAGGWLGRRAGGERIHLLALSDVPGDRLDVIGSGPCAGDPTHFADALAVVDRRDLRARLPPRVRAHLEAGARGEREETPKPGDVALERVRAHVIAANGDALGAARRAAELRGLGAIELGSGLQGEARVAGRRLGGLARAVRSERPLLLLLGGETAVTVRGDGLGGRNQELALAAALELAGGDGVALLAAGTDGSDGPTDAAGAFVDGETVARGAARGADARAALERNDAYGFFGCEGGLVRTGPTRTNVMDVAFVRVATGGGSHRARALR